jgi:hypothetical protein
MCCVISKVLLFFTMVNKLKTKVIFETFQVPKA